MRCVTRGLLARVRRTGVRETVRRENAFNAFAKRDDGFTFRRYASDHSCAR